MVKKVSKKNIDWGPNVAKLNNILITTIPGEIPKRAREERKSKVFRIIMPPGVLKIPAAFCFYKKLMENKELLKEYYSNVETFRDPTNYVLIIKALPYVPIYSWHLRIYFKLNVQILAQAGYKNLGVLVYQRALGWRTAKRLIKTIGSYVPYLPPKTKIRETIKDFCSVWEFIMAPSD